LMLHISMHSGQRLLACAQGLIWIGSRTLTPGCGETKLIPYQLHCPPLLELDLERHHSCQLEEY
jgi:hypothetical protein